LGTVVLLASLFIRIAFKHSAYLGYLIPAIGFVILVTLLFDSLELSLLLSLVISFFGASIDRANFEVNFNVGISLFVGSLVAAMFSFRARRRSRVISAGFLAGFMQFFIAFILEAMEGRQSFYSFAAVDKNLLTICLLNGVVSSIIVLGLLPIFEYIFKVVTTISLLELSDFTRPLIRRLILEAPGTYQHSLVVANLSEVAAEAIGANSLLARVGAYYHDIGKLVKPNYFIENQSAYCDAHKDLKPSMSKLIIINHVKEGMELAHKHHLNPRIIDFIAQHHGRSLVYYFYQRAKEIEPEAEHEEEYRYPGPKPQSKEIAIVSLADPVEALSRLLEEPSPSRIEEMVREIVRKKFMTGELDESSLTLKELEKITQSFIRMLNALFHTRINYPRDESQ
jgi:putative nucleotidyltransferase with HDIG domain